MKTEMEVGPTWSSGEENDTVGGMYSTHYYRPGNFGWVTENSDTKPDSRVFIEIEDDDDDEDEEVDFTTAEPEPVRSPVSSSDHEFAVEQTLSTKGKKPRIHPSEFASSLTELDLKRIREIYRIPEEIEMRLPLEGERAHDIVDGGWISMYEISFKIGLRLPIPLTIRDILAKMSVAPGQLMPNTWRVLLGLAGLAALEKVQLTPAMLTHCYNVQNNQHDLLRFHLVFRSGQEQELITGTTSGDKNWKDKFFFLRGSWEFDSSHNSLCPRVKTTWAQNAPEFKPEALTTDEKAALLKIRTAKEKTWSRLVHQSNSSSCRTSLGAEPKNTQVADHRINFPSFPEDLLDQNTIFTPPKTMDDMIALARKKMKVPNENENEKTKEMVTVNKETSSNIPMVSLSRDPSNGLEVEDCVPSCNNAKRKGGAGSGDQDLPPSKGRRDPAQATGVDGHVFVSTRVMPSKSLIDDDESAVIAGQSFLRFQRDVQRLSELPLQDLCANLVAQTARVLQSQAHSLARVAEVNSTIRQLEEDNAMYIEELKIAKHTRASMESKLELANVERDDAVKRKVEVEEQLKQVEEALRSEKKKNFGEQAQSIKREAMRQAALQCQGLAYAQFSKGWLVGMLDGRDILKAEIEAEPSKPLSPIRNDDARLVYSKVDGLEGLVESVAGIRKEQEQEPLIRGMNQKSPSKQRKG